MAVDFRTMMRGGFQYNASGYHLELIQELC